MTGRDSSLEYARNKVGDFTIDSGIAALVLDPLQCTILASWDPPPTGPRVERHILVKRARMQGFLVFDYVPRYEEAIARLAEWVRAGALRYREDILNGIEHAPGAIAGLYRGDNLGKRLIGLG